MVRLSMFEKFCFVLALMLLLPLAIGQIQPSPNSGQPLPTTDLSGLDAKVSVLINQNEQLRQQIALSFDENKIAKTINEKVDAQIKADSEAMRQQFLIMFIAEAMIIIGLCGVFYWFIASKIKKVYNAG